MNWKFALPDGFYSITHIQDYFEYVMKKHEKFADNPPLQRQVSRIQNGITFKINTGYYLEFFRPETIKLLESTWKIK